MRTQQCAQGLSTFVPLMLNGFCDFIMPGIHKRPVLCVAIQRFRPLGRHSDQEGQSNFQCGRRTNLSEKAIRKIADKVMKKLDEGDEADEVRTWARAECAK